MKIKLFIKALLISIVAFSLSYLCYNYSKDAFEQGSQVFWERVTVKANYKTFDENLSFKDIEKVVIQSINANIVLEASKSDEGKVSFTTGMDRFQAFHSEREGKKLIIKLSDLSPYSNSTLSLRLPTTVKSLVMSSVSGDIDCSVNIKEVKANAVNGDIKITTTLTNPEYRLETVSGDIRVIIPRSLKAGLDLKSINGEVELGGFKNSSSGSQEGYIFARSVNGDIRVED